MAYQLPPPDDLDDMAEHSHKIAKDLLSTYARTGSEQTDSVLSVITMTATYLIMSRFHSDLWDEMGETFGDVLRSNLQICKDGW